MNHLTLLTAKLGIWEEILTMLNNVLYGLNIIVWLALAVLLVILCLRTRSKGLMLISAILLISGIFNSIFEQVLNSYLDQWIAGERWQDMKMGNFLLRVEMVKRLLYSFLCLLGGFLVYREWQLGKFRTPQPEHIEDPKG